MHYFIITADKIIILECLLGLYWTGLTLLNRFPFLVIFSSFFILGPAVD